MSARHCSDCPFRAVTISYIYRYASQRRREAAQFHIAPTREKADVEASVRRSRRTISGETARVLESERARERDRQTGRQRRHRRKETYVPHVDDARIFLLGVCMCEKSYEVARAKIKMSSEVYRRGALHRRARTKKTLSVSSASVLSFRRFASLACET